MRTFFTHKYWVILLAVLAVVALTELAIGLKSMSFEQAQEFGQAEAQATGAASLQLVDSILMVPLETQLIAWTLFVLMFVLIGLLLSPEWRKRLIRIAIRVAITYWALYLLFTQYRDVLLQMGVNLAALGGTPAATGTGEPLPTFTPPETSSGLIYLLSFAVAVVLIVVAWKGYGLWKELQPHGSSESMQKLAQIARSSLSDLSAGRDTSDVILNCYQRMGEVVSQKKNLARKESMTPGEFAARLEGAGLPGDSVRTLTRLFESVRYGARKPDPKMEQEAVVCLTAILHYCGETV